MNSHSIYVYMLIMALVTYLLRMLPFTLFRKKITSPFIKNLLYYIPYAVLSAMAIPAAFYSTDYTISATVGVLIAVIFAYFRKSLLTVSIAAAIGAYITELLITMI
jgi:branched-subunit amino acid transport protein